MVSRQDTSVKGVGWTFTEWLFGIVGGIAAFLGLFIMFGPETEYVGLGGDLSWRVGDITDAWMYSLLVGGFVLLGIAVYMAIVGRHRPTAESTPLGDLALHAGIFTVVNAFVWIQDFALGDGLDYALWVTIPWAVALAIHAGVYFFGPKPIEAPAPQKTRELQHH
ncbi:MAG: 2TM domain-containing protein [Acidimicrobiia bacterium]